MRKGLIALGAVLIVLLIAYTSIRNTYNGFVQRDESVKAQLGAVATAYQQRADLIPNLVEVVKGAASNERETLEAVISARSRATSMQLTPEALKDPQAFSNFQKAQGDLSGALSRLMVVVEKYPELQSQANFPVLMSQLEGQENRIRVERNRYNDVVKEFNLAIRVFPASLWAGMFGFKEYPYFEAAAGAENAPKVSFGGSNTGATPATTAPATGGVPNPAEAPHGIARPAPVH